MIKNIELNNFKSHEYTQLDFSNLTVLCGANGVGKSSALQVLLLLRESFFNKKPFEYLDLKSNSVSIGTAKDALYQFSDKDELIFKISTDVQNIIFGFKINDPTKTLIPKLSEHILDIAKLESEPLFGKNCQFISAARLGPQSSYPKDDVVVDVDNQISIIEGKAEHFVHFLQRKKDMDVMKELCHSSIKFTDLFSQVTAWEREISSGVNVVVQDIGNLGYELKYKFNLGNDTTYDYKASNVGFGLTYVMPVIIALLSAPKDSILFIENPEAHLHPNGQAKLTELICLAAQAGIQIVLETHSDHIINGILVQCKNFEENFKGIIKENVSIYHFSRDEKKHCTKAEKVNIEENGCIRYAPKGFFDQFTIDRKRLMEF